MTTTNWHLVITHLPIFGSILGALVLGYGIWSKSKSTKSAAYLVFMISAIGASVAYLTGEGAEESIENISGISETLIEQHEDFAVYALISLIVLGVSSFLSLIITIKRNALAKYAAIVTLIVSLISFSFAVRTGYLGGRIRHTEIDSAAQ